MRDERDPYTTRPLNRGQGSGQAARSRVDEEEGAAHVDPQDRISSWQERAAVRRELAESYRQAHGELREMPTGMLAGLDADISYNYFQLGAAGLLALFSLAGTIFAFSGGGAAFIAAHTDAWASNPTQAVTTALLAVPTLFAFVVQAALFIVLMGQRHTNSAVQLGVTIISAGLTYVGWSSLIVPAGVAVLSGLTTTIPAVAISGILTWTLAMGMFEPKLARGRLIGLVVLGLVFGALGLPTMLQWLLGLVAFTGDQFARRKIVLG